MLCFFGELVSSSFYHYFFFHKIDNCLLCVAFYDYLKADFICCQWTAIEQDLLCKMGFTGGNLIVNLDLTSIRLSYHFLFKISHFQHIQLHT